MACLLADAKLVKDSADVEASLDRQDIKVSAVIERESIEAEASLKKEIASKLSLNRLVSEVKE